MLFRRRQRCHQQAAFHHDFGLVWSASLPSVLVYFPLLWWTPGGPKPTQQGKLTLYSSSFRKSKAGSQGGNLEVGTEAETMKEHCLLFPCSCSASFLVQPRTTFQGVVPPIVLWALLYQLTMGKMPPKDILTDQCYEVNSSTDVSSFWVCQVDNQGWSSHVLCSSLFSNLHLSDISKHPELVSTVHI